MLIRLKPRQLSPGLPLLVPKQGERSSRLPCCTRNSRTFVRGGRGGMDGKGGVFSM